MKNRAGKITAALLCFLVLACGGAGIGSAYAAGPGKAGPGSASPRDGELRGVWISYLEWNKLPRDERGFQAAVNRMFDNCADWGMNAVFVHVHSHGDAVYPSSILPWSKFASGEQGKALPYDPLAYMVKAAHERGLEFHAWFNPYRITGYLMSWAEVAEDSPPKRWLRDQDPANDRWVLKHGGQYYYNPAVRQVRELVVESVSEVVSRYDVDGVHFDDYFYPEVWDDSESGWFDRPEYMLSSRNASLEQWRRDNVSRLIAEVYRAVKESKPEAVFGVSPQGYVRHLRSDDKLFVDIDRWLSEEGYVDYIMPQLYWGFETKTSGGEPAPYAFENNLSTWIELKNRGSAKLYLGLAMYRAGSNTADGNEVSEWSRRRDIIRRQVERGRDSREVSGYCFFSYSSFLEEAAGQERDNLLPLFH